MAHFAKLDETNTVIEVHVVNNDVLNPDNEEQSGIDFLNDWQGYESRWVQTSYNGRIRKQYASIGYLYDPILDIFIAPQPFPSWRLNEHHDWVAPKAYPSEGHYSWNEDLLDWVYVETNA